MTRLVAKVSLWVALTTVIVVAGAHWVYYLVMWEWNRAAIAGTAFVAGAVLGSTALLLGRMRRIERRLDVLLLGGGDPAQAAPVDPEPRPHFPWLAGGAAAPAVALVALTPWTPPQEGVFIPIFLAAGLGLSAAAGVVERVAAARYEPHPALPDVSPAEPGFREVLRATPRRVRIAIALVSAFIVTGLVSALWFGGHYWAEPVGPGVTTMTIEVDSHGPAPAETEALHSVGLFCSLDSGVGARFLGVDRAADGALQLRLSPLLDEEAQERFIGCVEDATLEWHRLTVTGTTLSPETGN